MPYYIGDSKRDPNLENYPSGEIVIGSPKQEAFLLFRLGLGLEVEDPKIRRRVAVRFEAP